MPVRLPGGAPLAVAAALLATACTSDLPVPPGIRLTCEDGGCPAGFTCVATALPPSCVPSDQLGATPEVTLPAITPATARLDVDVRVQFTASKALGKDPVVRLGVDPPRLLVKDAASSGNVYVYRYAPLGDEPQAQDLLVTADLQDVAGLLGTNRTVGQVRFDFTTPGVVAPQLTGSPATTGGVIELAFTASEPLSAEPAVRVGGQPMTKVTARSSGLAYVFAYTSSGAEAEDPAGLPVTVDLVDAGGNTAAGLVAAAAVFDRTPPALEGPPAILPAPPAAVAAGTLVRATFTASEPLAADPVVRLGPALLDKGAQAGRVYAYGHVAAPADGEGALPLSFELEDLAGNTATVPGPSVTLDFGPPAITALTLCADDGTAAPCAASAPVFSARPGHDALKVSFTLSEPPGPGSPVVTVGTTVLPAAACTVAGLGAVCRTTVTDPAGGAQPRVETAGVYVETSDAAGNRTLATVFATLDFKPPGLAGQAVLERCDAYGPARLAQDDLWTKAVDAYGCEYFVSGGRGPVRVTFTLDEPIAFTPFASGVTSVETDLGPGGFWLDGGTTSPTQFAAIMTVTPAEGVRTVRARVVDPVGNEALLDLGTLRVDATPPAGIATGTEGLVVYERFPWGSDATKGAKAFYLRATAGAATPGAAVVAYDGSDLTRAAVIGRTTAFGDGSFGGPPGSTVAFPISSGDRAEVFVSQEDLAGNPSAPALVWDGEWTSTPGFKVAGDLTSNPGVLSEDPAWRDARHASSQREVQGASLLGKRFQGEAVTAAAPDVREATPTADRPGRRGACAMAWDSDLGRAVMFGGYYDFRAAAVFTRIPYDDTWSWNGRRWRRLETQGSPPPDPAPAMAYDPARGRMVLVTGALETWELADTTWRRVCWPGCTPGTQCTCTASPSSNRFAFYEPVEGRVVVDGAWAWNGATWRALAPAQALPAGAALGAARPDAAGALALVVGSGTWSWNGATWSGPGPLPPGTGSVTGTFTLWWDAGQGAFLAWNRFADTLSRWNGSGWTALPPPVNGAVPATGPLSQRGCAAVEPDSGAVFSFGGCSNGGCTDADGPALDTTVRLDTSAARLLTPGVSPAARRGPGMADVRDEARAWLDQGLGADAFPYRDDWAWDGYAWTGGPSSSSYDGQYRGALSWLGPGRLVKFGGLPFGPGAAFPFPDNRTWWRTTGASAWTTSDPGLLEPGTASWDDPALAWDLPRSQLLFFSQPVGTWTGTYSVFTGVVAWQARATGTPPKSVSGHRLAYCASAGGTVLFGGVTAGGALLDETWVWNGAGWTQASPAVHPSARRRHAMFCDEERDKLLLFGGVDAAGAPLSDWWEYDGTTWRPLAPSESPSARSEAGAAYVSGRGEAVLFGGYGLNFLGDTWVVDGGRDRKPAQVFHAPFAAAGTGAFALRSLGATWYAMASADNPAGPSYLAGLHVRDGTRWIPSGSPNFAGDPLVWSTAGDPAWSSLPPATRAARLRRLLGGDRLELSVALAPAGTSATLPGGASVTTTYLEARVAYRLACLAAGASTTTPLRCCSGVAFGATCQ